MTGSWNNKLWQEIFRKLLTRSQNRSLFPTRKMKYQKANDNIHGNTQLSCTTQAV